MLKTQFAFFSIIIFFCITSNATLPTDSIQHCLDVRRLVDFTTKQKMTAKEPGVLRFKFHKILINELPITKFTGSLEQIIHALDQQIINCSKKQGEFQSITIAGQYFKRDEWCLNANNKLKQLALTAHGDFQKFITAVRTHFDWYKSDGWPENYAGFKKGAFQFTAYYAPAAIEAHSRPSRSFPYPIYSNPGVINTLLESKKYRLNNPLCGVDPLTQTPRAYCLKHTNGSYSVAPDREEINRGAIDPKFIIGYVKDPNDPAFLMLEGSGSLILDGKLVRLNYDGYNGRPRTMLGRIVQCAQDPTCGGNIDEMERCAKNPKCRDESKLRCNVSKNIKISASSEKYIRKYLNTLIKVNKADDLRNRDQSYVFFTKEQGGPYGSENIPLTSNASCATDHRVIPIGMSFIYTCNNTSSFCVAQDTGGAIVGAHVDVYKGEGVQAGIDANNLNHTGSLYLALPKK